MAKRTRDERHILEMFQYMRPTGSKTEQRFIDRFLTPLGFKRDPFKNLVVTVGDNPVILWSSHVDTVHYDEGIQTLHYDGEMLGLSQKSKRTSSCLGADDTAGIWLMTEMIKAGVPGVYVIHHAEESGCVGSGDLARYDEEFFKDIQAAIAFDRYGTKSIITHQMGRRCASEAFSASLGGALRVASGGLIDLKSDDGGSYTDTNEYRHLVPECTNISVGYYSQHTSRETQDVPYLISLRDALVSADFSALVFERDPTAKEESHVFGHGFWHGSRTYHGYEDDDRNYPEFPEEEAGEGASRSLDSLDIKSLVALYPHVAAEVLQAFGLTRFDFLQEITAIHGTADALAY
jgi:hypothetical protein